MIESRGNGMVRAIWMETTGGGNVDAWNAMSRLSTDGGATWGTPSRVSDATSGAAYKTAGRVRRGLRRLRRDRVHQCRQGGRRVG